MAIKKPIPITFNLDSHQSVQSVCAVIHIDDKNTETLDLSLLQGGEHVETPSNSTVTARFVRVKDKILISDNVACTVQENGNIYIPIDNAAAHMLVGEIKIEVNIVDENDILTMQFPLVIRVNNTILADAEICPISKGTIPELIEKAQETADNAQETANTAQQMADNAQAAASTAQQTADSAQTAANSAQQTADNAMAELGNKQDTLTAGDNITIENNVISATGGVTDYDELENKPQINNNDLIGNVSFSNEFNIEALEDLLNIEIATIDGNKVHNIPLTSLANTFSDGLFLEVAQNDLNDYGKDLNYWGYLNSRNHISGEGNICVRITNTSLFRHLPEYVYTNNLNCTVLSCSTYNSACGFQLVFTRDIVNINKTKIFARYRASSYPFTSSWQPWQELTGGGAQIVSGVVNANGTITFTDLEGNSFTTSGESVIGPQGAPGQDYVLTAQDKTNIANIVLSELPTTEGVLYGNQSN